MGDKVLVTGGAGFIGSHLVDGLLKKGYAVRVFDSLDPQVHGRARLWPDYLSKEAEWVWGDMRDLDALSGALDGVRYVLHQAAVVGVAQSMYEIRRYVEANTLGSANLLQLLSHRNHKVEKVLVASSMSVYGEGAYRCESCGVVYPALRSEAQLADRLWEMTCPTCGCVVEPTPTSEDKPLCPTSLYAITKRDHEEMFLTFGRAYGIPVVALRYFNVYGTRQALSNPYTGVLAIFASRLLGGKPPLVFEDGAQARDFVHVSDIVQANLLTLENSAADYSVFNVGTGEKTTVLQVAETLAKVLDIDIRPEIVAKFRVGDIRHCYAYISRISETLGYRPAVRFSDGVASMIDWLRSEQPVDRVEGATQELLERGLVR
jgi:dTDP-L-rhamnose 4-epimerase